MCICCLFFKLFLIQNLGLWVEGEQEVSCGKRPCSEQGSEPRYILEIGRVSLGLNSGLRPQLSTRPDVSPTEDRRLAAQCSAAADAGPGTHCPQRLSREDCPQGVYAEVSAY